MPEVSQGCETASTHKSSSVDLVVKPRRFAICRQIATFPKAEFVAAHSRKGGICCGSQPPMLFLIYHRQHLCHRSIKLSRYLLTYVYRLVKPSCERTVFSDIYIMLLRHCNYPQCQCVCTLATTTGAL